MFDPKAYNIKIENQNVDGDEYYVGTVLELPDVVIYGANYDSTYSELIMIITDLKTAADDQGRQFPVPRRVRDIKQPKIISHGLFAEHDQCCPVLHEKSAVFNCTIGVFYPSWEAQSQGWKLIHANTPLKRFLLRFF